MIERVIFTEKAGDDVARSYDWYESRGPGLGEDFLRCVEACVLTIQRHPHLFPVAVDEFRRALVRRFPYEIFYVPTANALVIDLSSELDGPIFRPLQDPDVFASVRLEGGTIASPNGADLAPEYLAKRLVEQGIAPNA